MDNVLMNTQWSRRDFLRISACTAAAAALVPLPGVALGNPATGPAEKLTLDQCCQLSPLEMAQKSAVARASYQFLLKMGGEIQDSNLRHSVIRILQQPVPLLMQRYQLGEAREALCQRLVAAGLLKSDVTIAQLLPPLSNLSKPPQPFASAPGSSYFSHHAYPGGLTVHTAFNLRSSLGLCNNYDQVYGLKLTRDVVLAAQLLHDLHKPWVFQWQNDNSSLPEYTIAGTGAHHILGIAESIYRGLPAAVVIAQACAHDHVGLPEDEAKVVGYLKAAAIMAGKNPIEAGLLSSSGTSVVLPRSIESFVIHLGDHDAVLSVPAAKWTIALLEKVACTDYGMQNADLKSAKFNSFRNYVFSQGTMIGLYQVYSSRGEEGFRAAVNNLVMPV